jgi:hypothetical protein
LFVVWWLGGFNSPKKNSVQTIHHPRGGFKKNLGKSWKIFTGTKSTATQPTGKKP